MEAATAAVASLRPPLIVHVSPCTSPTAYYASNTTNNNAMMGGGISPDSPLSSAPNSPGRSDDDDDDDDQRHPRMLDDLILQNNAAASYLDLPPLVGGYPLQRQNSEVLGRESRKSRLRASRNKATAALLRNHNSSYSAAATITKTTNELSTDARGSNGNGNTNLQQQQQQQNFASLEEKKSDSDSCASPPDEMLQQQQHGRENSSAFEGNNTIMTTKEEEEGDELLLLPQHRRVVSPLKHNEETGNFYKEDVVAAASASAAAAAVVNGSSYRTEESPLDEVDELLGGDEDDDDHHHHNYCYNAHQQQVQSNDDIDQGVCAVAVQQRRTVARWNPQNCVDVGTSPVEMMIRSKNRLLLDRVGAILSFADGDDDDELMQQQQPLRLQSSPKHLPSLDDQQQHLRVISLAPSYDEADGTTTSCEDEEEEIEISYELQMNACFQLHSLDPVDPFYDEFMDEDDDVNKNNRSRRRSTMQDTFTASSSAVSSSSSSGQPPPSPPKQQPLLTTCSSASLQQLQPLLPTQRQPSFYDQDLHMAPTDESDAVHSYHKKLGSVKSRFSPGHHGSNKDVSSSVDPDTLLVGTVEVTPNVVQPQDDDAPLDEILLDLSSATVHWATDDDSFIPVGASISSDRQLPKRFSPQKKELPTGSDASNAIAVEDLTETTSGSMEEHTSLHNNLLDLSSSSSSCSERSSSSSGILINPMMMRRIEQHQPLLLQQTAADGFSSSDETPLARGQGGYGCAKTVPDRRHIRRSSSSSRKNRVYGEANLHDYWRKQKATTTQQQRQQQLRSKYGKARQAKAVEAKSPDRMLLPPLVVDQDQLRSIGIKAMMAVCNGIGSLFLSNQEAVEPSSSTKERRAQIVEPYQKLLPETSEHRRRRSRGLRDGKSEPVIVGEKWRHEWSPQHSAKMSNNAAFFEEALQQSIAAELIDGDIAAHLQIAEENSAIITVETEPQVATLLPKQQPVPQEKAVVDGLVNQQYAINRTMSLPVNSSHRADAQNDDTTKSASTTNSAWWIEDVLAIRLQNSKKEQDSAPRRTSCPIALTAPVQVSSSSQRPLRKREGKCLSPAREIPSSRPFPELEDEGWSLAKEIAKRSHRRQSSRVAVAERIAAARESRSSEKPSSAPSSSSIATHVVEDSARAAGGTHEDFDWRNSMTGTMPSIVMNGNTVYSPAIDCPEEGFATSPVPPFVDRHGQTGDTPSSSKLGFTVDHSPLAEPPQLRRLNVSLDLKESFGPDFASEVLDDVEPPSLSLLTSKETKEVLSFPVLEKPMPDRSPMSDFLVSRMHANIGKFVVGGTPDTEVDEDRRWSSNDSNCSSTGELLSSLDGLVKDLDGLASARRIERSLTYDSQSANALSLPDTIQASTLKTVLSESSHPLNVRHDDGMPVLVDALNSDLGIPMGDIMVSLLNNEQSVASTWTSRVDEAIWRCRTMRRHCDTHWLDEMALRTSGSPSQGRTSVCVDVDDARVVGGIDKISDTQKAALEHLKYDDFDDALALYEDICWSYEQHAAELEKADDKFASLKHYVATAFYNLGIMHLLRGEHEEALEYFERSTKLQADWLGIGHVDHVVSFLSCLVNISALVLIADVFLFVQACLVKTAMCRFALEDYSTAYPELELALSLSREAIHTISDHRQIAEILNSLGCLSYMGGEIERAMLFFRESLKVQIMASEHSMYVGSKFSCHAASLNLSITKANIGFLSLTFFRDASESVTALESAVKVSVFVMNRSNLTKELNCLPCFVPPRPQDQQLLLRDAHVTLITTMVHLAVANLLAGSKLKALQLLQRVFHMQVDAFGQDDERCKLTRNKIVILERDESPPLDETTNSSMLPILETSQEMGFSSDTSLSNALFKVWRKQNAFTDSFSITT